ncbi:hypothetical protein K449DRAFT_440161 [Hypoxylon sp. EC38]|nr:hypothetical protein K449DRAFT_440161 [Hypoxylon sp. EC38]
MHRLSTRNSRLSSLSQHSNNRPSTPQRFYAPAPAAQISPVEPQVSHLRPSGFGPRFAPYVAVLRREYSALGGGTHMRAAKFLPNVTESQSDIDTAAGVLWVANMLHGHHVCESPQCEKGYSHPSHAAFSPESPRSPS